MATAKKTKSGNYRCLIYVGKDENGKRKYKSFTAATKKEAERLATMWSADNVEKSEYPTFEEAAEKYIELRRNEMSVNTVREYYRMVKKDLAEFKKTPVNQITEEILQDYINRNSKRSSKTLKNRICFAISVIEKAIRQQTGYRFMYPQYIKKEIVVPEIDEIKRLLKETEGSDMHLPIALAAMCGLRRSEITSISELKDGYITVKESEARDDSGNWIKQSRTKTVAGTRKIKVPDMIADELKNTEYPYVEMNPAMITEEFRKIKKKGGYDFRFHDLRHFCASFLMTMNYPNKYIISYMGHGSEDMVNKVYYHTFKKESTEMENKMYATLNATFPQ